VVCDVVGIAVVVVKRVVCVAVVVGATVVVVAGVYAWVVVVVFSVVVVELEVVVGVVVDVVVVVVDVDVGGVDVAQKYPPSCAETFTFFTIDMFAYKYRDVSDFEPLLLLIQTTGRPITPADSVLISFKFIEYQDLYKWNDIHDLHNDIFVRHLQHAHRLEIILFPLDLLWSKVDIRKNQNIEYSNKLNNCFWKICKYNTKQL